MKATVQAITADFLKMCNKDLDDYEKRTPVGSRVPLKQVFKANMVYELQRMGIDNTNERADDIIELLYQIAEFCDRLEPYYKRKTFLEYRKSAKRMREGNNEA